jgi:hypothetical protein
VAVGDIDTCSGDPVDRLMCPDCVRGRLPSAGSALFSRGSPDSPLLRGAGKTKPEGSAAGERTDIHSEVGQSSPSSACAAATT